MVPRYTNKYKHIESNFKHMVEAECCKETEHATQDRKSYKAGTVKWDKHNGVSCPQLIEL